MKVLLRHTYTCLTLLYSLTILYSCNGDRAFRERLTSIDSLLQTCPDSAYNILSSIEDEAQDQASSNRMYYELLRADAQNKTYVSFTTDSVMKQVAQYYEDHGTPNQQMRAYYLLGCTYRDMGDAPTELEYFQRAVESADTTASDCDYHTLVAVYGQMAEIYNSQYITSEELKALSACQNCALKGNDRLTGISAYELRIRAYYHENNHDSVLFITKNARKMYLDYGEKRKAAKLLVPAISMLIDKGDYLNAKHYMDIYEKESGYFDGERINDKEKYYFHDKGRYFLHNCELDSVKIYSQYLLSKKEKEAAYDLLMQLYIKLNQPDSVSKYAKLYALANDSSFAGKSTETIARMVSMYKYGRMKKKSEQATLNLLKAQETITFMLFILLLLACIFIIGYTLYVRQKKAAIQRIATLTYQLEDATKRYNKFIVKYNRETKDQTDMLNAYKDREVMLINLQNEIEDLKGRLINERAENLQNTFFQADIYKVFKASGLNGKTQVTDTDWENLKSKFENHFIKFSNFLQTQSLTLDQYRVAMLLRLGLKESEIANIMCKTSTRINKIKIQLNTKLFNRTDAKTLRENLKSHF